MICLNVNGRNGKVNWTLPTELYEINAEYLKAVTDCVKVADNYVLVALCFRERISTLLMSVKEKVKKLNSNVIPLFVKAGTTDNDYIKTINTTEKLIIGSSDLALGHHVYSPKNVITVDKFLQSTEGDANLYSSAMKYKDYVYFVEFKLIPAVSIKGHYTNVVTDFESPFVSKVVEDKA